MNQIVVPHEIVNDETVTLVEWLVADGHEVKSGQVVARLESSKGVIDIESPQTGFLRHQAKAGEELPIGAPLCAIASSLEEKLPETPAAPSPPPAPAAALEVGRVRPAEPGSEQAPELGSVPRSDGAHGSDAPYLPDGSPGTDSPYRGTRFSKAALELIEAKGLDVKTFAGQGLVTATKVLESMGMARPASRENPPAGPAAVPEGGVGSPGRTSAVAPLGAMADVMAERRPTFAAPPGPASVPEGVSFRAEDLTRSKRAEVQFLGAAQRTVMPSMVGVLCESGGLKEAFSQPSASGTSALAVILAETARLLRKHPVLNAFFKDGKIHYYEEVNVGFALDAGLGLKVPVIRRADTKSAAEIEGEIKDFVFNYLEKTLPVSAMAGGTFTVTDLSNAGVFTVQPLINQWQGAILAVGAEFKPKGSAAGFFQLLLAFDHQITEGRTAAEFLQDLRDRLAAYERALAPVGGEPAEKALECSRCQRTADELERLRAFLLEQVRGDGSRGLICSLCVSGY